MTKTASSRRTILFSIIPFIIILLILFLTMWLPFLGIMKECRDVFYGKISSDDPHLSTFNFESESLPESWGVSHIEGSIVFLLSWRNKNTGVIYAISNRYFYGSDGNVVRKESNEPVKIEVVKENGVWKISKVYYTVI